MTKLSIISAFLLASTVPALAQFTIPISGGDSTNKATNLTIEGYADVYFAYDINAPKDANRPYFVSASRHNEFNINLAYLSLKFQSSRVRATFTPGFGTYMNANYAAEKVTLKNILEANVGVRLFKNKNIWLDAGVIGSPYTNESAISFDQIMYTRSFAPEYVPYYLTGAKLSIPVKQNLNVYLYLLNGWQVIEDVNSPLAMGTQVEYRPGKRWLLNWNTYYGNENSASAPDYSNRFFSDVYAVYQAGKKVTLAACVYGGLQQKMIPDGKSNNTWWQANISSKIVTRENQFVSARLEYFSDPKQVMIKTVTGVPEFHCYSASLGYNVHITPQVMFRAEARYFQSKDNIFYTADGQTANQNLMLTGGLTAKF